MYRTYSQKTSSLLAVGVTAGQPTVWTSPDGLSWTRVLLDDALFDDVNPIDTSIAVVAGGPGWVAVGGTTDGGPAAWTSPDGATWTRLSDDAFGGGPTERLVAVTATTSQLLAVGEGSSLWTSTDGTTWTNIPHEVAERAEGEPRIAAAVADDTKVIVVGAVGDGSVESRPAVWNATLPD